jgi:hypothetical protein
MVMDGRSDPTVGILPKLAALRLIATQALKELASRGHRLPDSPIAGKPLPRRRGTIKYSRGSS